MLFERKDKHLAHEEKINESEGIDYEENCTDTDAGNRDPYGRLCYRMHK